MFIEVDSEFIGYLRENEGQFVNSPHYFPNRKCIVKLHKINAGRNFINKFLS